MALCEEPGCGLRGKDSASRTGKAEEQWATLSLTARSKFQLDCAADGIVGLAWVGRTSDTGICDRRGYNTGRYLYRG